MAARRCLDRRLGCIEVAEPVAATPVERDEIRVMFLRIRDDVREMKRTWERLEGLVGTRGRKFFGAFEPSTGEYRVCVQIHENDEPAVLGLETGTLPGGRYLRARLRGEPPALYERIGPTFEALASSVSPDETRPSIEFYRRRDEVDLLLPVAGP
jgi:DNA gyrase inhibitor GyrI